MSKGRAMMFGKRETDEDKAKLAATREGITALEAAYRQFFADHNVRALLLPCFPREITLAVDAVGLTCLKNEFFFTPHMNEIPVPSIAMPVHAVKHKGSGVPCSLLLYGVDDGELLGIALALEEALISAG